MALKQIVKEINTFNLKWMDMAIVISWMTLMFLRCFPCLIWALLILMIQFIRIQEQNY